MKHEPAPAWRVAVPALILGMVAGFGSTRMWIRHTRVLDAPVSPSPSSPVAGSSAPLRVPLPEVAARSVRARVLELAAHADERRRLRTGLGFEGPYLMSTDLTTRLIASEIEDVRQAEGTWSLVKKDLELAELPLPDQGLLAMLLAHRYLSLADLVAFKRSAPGWLEGPALGRDQADFFDREIQETQGARAMQSLGEYLDIALVVFTGSPGDPREAAAAVETQLLFFDVSRAVATHAWTPGYRPRVDQLQQRIEAVLGSRSATGAEPGASVARLAWIAWKSGRSDLGGDVSGLEVELHGPVEALRAAGVPISAERFRALFPYAYPGTERAAPGPDLPFPPP